MSSNTPENSPFRPLWKGTTTYGNTKYTGDHICPCCHHPIFINMVPNKKKTEKMPDFNVSLAPKMPKPTP